MNKFVTNQTPQINQIGGINLINLFLANVIKDWLKSVFKNIKKPDIMKKNSTGIHE